MSPKRQSLAGMLPDSPAKAPPIPVRTPPSPPELQAPVQQAPVVPRPSPSRPAPRVPQPVTPALPKYQRLHRKELLMDLGQMSRLDVLARMLNKGKGGAGERITVNTLLRIGGDLLLERAGELNGDTEDELRRSLGLPG